MKYAIPDNVTNSEIEYCIDELIHSERDRALLKRRLIDKICFEPLAEEFELSPQRTKSIVYQHINKILAKLK